MRHSTSLSARHGCGLAATLAAAAVAGAVTLQAGPAGAAGTGGFGVRPAHTNPADPSTRAYFKPTVGAGGTFSDQVVVDNTSAAPLDLVVSPVDGLTGQTSGAVYANRQDPVTKAGAWVKPAVSSLTVPAGATATVPFSVEVPASAPAGDHLAGLAFENAHPTSGGGGTFSVTEVYREVVGISVLVPGAAAFGTHIDTLSLQAMAGPGIASVSVGLANTGLRLGKPELSVTLSGPSGYHRTVTRQLDTILPGDVIDYPLAWPDPLPAGDYTVQANATGGATGGATAASLTSSAHLAGALIGTSAGPSVVFQSPPPPTRAAPRGGLPRWTLVGALGAGALGVMAVLAVLRLRRPRPAPPPSRPGDGRPGDELGDARGPATASGRA